MNAFASWNPNAFLAAPPPGWLNVGPRFARLFQLINVPEAAHDDGLKKAVGIVTALHREYWPHGWPEPPGKLAGSWGKNTRVHPSGDLDLLYLLPAEVYHRFEQRQGNRQSQLLQEVKAVLAPTYPRTDLRGDGQVVVVDFVSIKVEVVPVFRATNGGLITCDTNNGGRYKTSDPAAEVAALDATDQATRGLARGLVRLIKLWRRSSGADIPSFAIEILATQFLASYAHADQQWWDWLVRDFFGFLHGRANTWIYFPATGEPHWLGDGWAPAALRALRAADAACAYERINYDGPAADQWCAVFGRRVLAA